MFDYISTTHHTHLSQCGCCSMVEEMNEIRRKYLNKTPLKDIIKECICNRHGHQYCISEEAVNNATEALFGSKFIQDNCTEVPFIKENQKRYDLNECFNDFEELYDFIRFAIGGITGIGPLTVYDTARRIGHLYKKPIYPKMYVYLAAGAKKGLRISYRIQTYISENLSIYLNLILEQCQVYLLKTCYAYTKTYLKI